MLGVTFTGRKQMRTIRGIAVLASLCMLGCLGAEVQASVQAPAKKPAATQKAPVHRAATAAKGPFDRALLNPAALRLRAPAEFDVKFETTAGDFTMKVTRAWAPYGADRFYNLVRHHFYDGAAFFRVLPGFMAQFGLSAYPQVSRAWQNANIRDDKVLQSNKRGYVSFAMAGPNTRTTQIFINFGDNGNLDQSGFSPFAMVTEGMETVDKLYSGYGEGAPDGHGPNQELVGTRGRAYLEKSFPKLDTIRTASIVPAAPKPAAAQ
jgi:cyclophilin family peptidyl-prolyl cis-trans isomerase